MCLEAVVTAGSIRKAAQRLGMQPPAVSRQIQALERETGIALFDRRADGTVPTPAAEYVLEYYRVWSGQLEHLKNQLDELADLRSGSVSVAASEGLIPSLTEEVLWDFTRKYPGVRLLVQMKATSEIVEDVQKGFVHIGLAYSPPATVNIRFHAGVKHRVVAAVRPDHPLAMQKDGVPLGRVIAYPFGTMPPIYGLGQLIETIAAAEHLRFTPTLRANTLDVLKRFAIAGLGAALVTDYSVRAEVADGQLVTRTIDHPMLGNQHARVFVKSDRMLTAAAAELLHWIEHRMSVFTAPADAEEALA